MDWFYLWPLIGLALWFIHKYLTANDEFFEKRKVKYIKPTLFFGTIYVLFFGKDGSVTMFQKLYDHFRDEKLYGIFFFRRPIFVLKDVELIKQITVTEFDSFINHDEDFSRGVDAIFSKSVFLLENARWREMRHTLSPIFTSSKIKMMYNHMIVCANDLNDYFNEMSCGNTKRIIISSKNTFAKYTADVISSTALGFKGNCIKDENSQVFKVALSIQDAFNKPSGLMKMMFRPLAPNICNFFGINIFSETVYNFFNKYVLDEIKHRESKGIKNVKDVIQLLIEAKNGQLKHQGKEADDSLSAIGLDYDAKTVESKKITDWTDMELVAQVFIFFGGGFESTSTFLQTCSWELAMNPDIQKQLIDEVDATLEELDGKPITYEVLNKMKYLDMVINENTRKWPPLPFTSRSCTKDCTIKTSDGNVFEFKKGDVFQLGIRSIQHDEKYFENPESFDPTRFSDENKHKIIPGSILTFGYGPRLCLGARLALLESKLIIFTILTKYTIEVCEETPSKLTYSKAPVAFNEEVKVELKRRM